MAPTRTWSAATNKSVNAVIRVFAIALLDSVLVSLATLVLHASALLALTTALVTELAVPTGTLPTTGQLPRPPRSNPTKPETNSLSCSRKPTSLPTMTHGTLTCTTVASAMRATVVQVALWWSAPRRLIPLMTSALPVPQSRTSSCNTTLPSEVQAGKMLTPKNQACQGNNTLWKTVTTTVSTLLIQMAARFTVATVLCLVKTALAVVSVTSPVAHASASADTLALLARRWKKWRNVMMTSVMIINLNINYKTKK